MESRDYIRPFLALLVTIGLVVLVIVLIVKAFAGGGSTTNQPDITKYADTPGSSVTLLVDGPTDIDQEHSQVKITVSAAQNEIDIIQGYQNTITANKTYPNNSAAYAAFLRTLKLLNFSKGQTANIDYRGYCPTGDRYLLSFYNGQNNLFTYWATSCGGQGTFEGKLSSVLHQFRVQIPPEDFGQLTNSTDVSL